VSEDDPAPAPGPQARRCLEIGVQPGHTFRTVAIAQRVGVDPRLLFDTTAVANDTTTLHAMTSDRFFAEAASTKPFDIGFIDGLHVFEQGVRGPTNTLAWTGWHSASPGSTCRRIATSCATPASRRRSTSAPRRSARAAESFAKACP